MTLDNLNTSKFLADPKSKTFEQDLIKRSKIFDLKIKGIDRKKALIYLVVLYDNSTELRRNIKELAERKREAGIISGFQFDEEEGFAEREEDLMVGEIEEFNQAVVEYLFYNFDRDFIDLIIRELKFPEFMKSIYTGKWGEKTGKMIDDYKSGLDTLEDTLFGGREVLNMRQALRQGTANMRLKIRAEDEIIEFEKNGLKNGWSPYGMDYQPGKITLVGSEIPDE